MKALSPVTADMTRSVAQIKFAPRYAIGGSLVGAVGNAWGLWLGDRVSCMGYRAALFWLRLSLRLGRVHASRILRDLRFERRGTSSSQRPPMWPYRSEAYMRAGWRY